MHTTPHTPEARARIAKAVRKRAAEDRRVAQYRADYVAFMEWTVADVADEHERRAVQIKLARRLVVNAPKDDRAHWRAWQRALEDGKTIAVKTYKLRRTHA